MDKRQKGREILVPVVNKENKKQLQRYEEYILKYNGSSLMQSIHWADSKFDWVPEYVYLENENKIVAAMSILFKKIPYMNCYMAYCPRGPVCDVYDIDTVEKLISEIEKLKSKYNIAFLKFDPNVKYDLKLEELYKKHGYKILGKNVDKDDLIQPLHDMIIYLNNFNEEELLKSFSEKTRYNIRLAKRKGVEVYYSRKKEDLKIFYDLYKITAVRDKIGCRAYEYFETMLDSYDEKNLRIYIAKHEDTYLSAAIAFNYGGELFYLYGASSNEKRNLMPNYLMQWEMIRWASESNCQKYNFGGVLHLEPNNGLYKFKIGFCKKDGVTEYIGEIDKVYNKFVYFVYTHILPGCKKIKRKIRNIKRSFKK